MSCHKLIKNNKVVGHICMSSYDLIKRSIRRCPTENKRRRMFSWCQAWYGWTTTCLGCGDTWYDGELGKRPFQRGWREENIKDAKNHWKYAKPRFKSASEMLEKT